MASYWLAGLRTSSSSSCANLETIATNFNLKPSAVLHHANAGTRGYLIDSTTDPKKSISCSTSENYPQIQEWMSDGSSTFTVLNNAADRCFCGPTNTYPILNQYQFECLYLNDDDFMHPVTSTGAGAILGCSHSSPFAAGRFPSMSLTTLVKTVYCDDSGFDSLCGDSIGTSSAALLAKRDENTFHHIEVFDYDVGTAQTSPNGCLLTKYIDATTPNGFAVVKCAADGKVMYKYSTTSCADAHLQSSFVEFTDPCHKPNADNFQCWSCGRVYNQAYIAPTPAPIVFPPGSGSSIVLSLGMLISPIMHMLLANFYPI